MSKIYHIFISHSWTYNDEYEKLVEMLDNSGISYKNFSVPKDDPIHTKGSDKELYSAIKEKISRCSIVLILAGVYSSYSKWIDKEIKISKKEFSKQKPIIAIAPWGAEKTSAKVKENANKIVGWNTKSIVDAINNLAIENES